MLLLGIVTEYPEMIVLKEGIKTFLIFHGNVNIFILEKAVRCNLNFCGLWKFFWPVSHDFEQDFALHTAHPPPYTLWNSQKTQYKSSTVVAETAGFWYTN